MTQHPHLSIQPLFEANQAIWSRWLENVQGLTEGSIFNRAERAYQEQLDAAEKAVQGALGAQSEWLQNWRQNLRRAEHVPQGWAQLSESMTGMMEQWLETRSRLWSTWFDSARSTEATMEQLLGANRHAPANVVAAWQDMSRRILEQQSEWLRGVGPEAAAAPAEDTPPPKTNGAAKRSARAEAKSA